MLSISLLASGQLGFQILQQLEQSSYLLTAVFTDYASQSIIDYCKSRNIPLFRGNPRGGKATAFIKDIECEVLLSVNYLFLIEFDLIRLPRQYAINFHGSLLPRYRGRSPHVWSIINGETETGVTAHLIDEEVDNGAIVKQIRIAIPKEATGGEILQHYQDCYPDLVFQVLRDVENRSLRLSPQDPMKATYFGKRTPDDGLINWDWSRERIRNWIRAQADPYPGAFTFYNNQKIKIHKAKADDSGFDYRQTNGTILSVETSGIIVKTSNGALRLEAIEGISTSQFVVGTCLQQSRLAIFPKAESLN